MTNKERLKKDIDQLFWNIPLDNNVKKIEQRIKTFIEENFIDENNESESNTDKNKYIIKE